jgi:hypothetical protein
VAVDHLKHGAAAPVREARHGADQLAAVADVLVEGLRGEAFVRIGVVEGLYKRPCKRRRHVLVARREGVGRDEELDAAVLGDGVLDRLNDVGRAEGILRIGLVPALEDKEERPAGPVAEHLGEIAERVARLGIGRIEADEELVVDREGDAARGVKQNGGLCPRRARVEEGVELLREVAAGVEIDDGEARVGLRQPRPEQIAVKRARGRSQVR